MWLYFSAIGKDSVVIIQQKTWKKAGNRGFKGWFYAGIIFETNSAKLLIQNYSFSNLL